jgi:hypothetical protein
MKTLAVLLLATLPVPQISIPRHATAPEPHLNQAIEPAARKGGKWYFARTGHAVYCYGPVMNLSDPTGQIEKVATFCRGNQLMVPLKD